MRTITSFRINVENNSVVITYDNGDFFTGRLDVAKLASFIENEAQVPDGQFELLEFATQ